MHDDIIQSECGTLDSIPEATRSMPSKGREVKGAEAGLLFNDPRIVLIDYTIPHRRNRGGRMRTVWRMDEWFCWSR